MTAFEETRASGQGARPLGWRFSAALQRLRRLKRRIGRRLDIYYSLSDVNYRLSDFNERMIYDLGVELIDLRKIRNPRRGEAILRLRRMRRRGKMRSWYLDRP